MGVVIDSFVNQLQNTENIIINKEVDGNFPNHHPDPTVDKNLYELVKVIKNGSYDFGVAFDGDADRVVVVDEVGNIIRSDILMAIFLSEVVNEGDKIKVDSIKGQYKERAKE